MKPTTEQICSRASPRPWSYHNDGRRDWVEDACGRVILESLGHIDGPLIVACVNEANACGTEEEALREQGVRETA